MLLISNALRRSCRAFRSATGGNVSILFAISLVPLLGLVGLGVDYGMAFSAKTKLDNAADAAAIAAVTTAKAYVAANPSDANVTANAVSAGLDRAKRAFAVNAGSISFATTSSPTVTLTRSTTGQTFTSTVQYRTSMQNNFGQLFNMATSSISGSTSASADIPSYLDFYLLIDVSASMGLPSTLDGQNYLAANNNNCQFACHFPDQASGYNFATAKGIQLRSGAVNSAVCGLLTLAKSPAVPNQYRVGIYPFVSQMAVLSPLSSNYASLWSAATCDQSSPMAFTSLLDSGASQLTTGNDTSTGDGSGGTHFESALSSVQAIVSPFGDGSSALKSKPFVFLVTDGMQNSQQFAIRQYSKWYYPGGSSLSQQPNKSWWTGTSPAAMDGTLCTALKNAGAVISILYIPYTTMVVTNLNTQETVTANAAIPNISSNLQACATSGYFYTANTPSDINAALANMFNQAVQMAHLIR